MSQKTFSGGCGSAPLGAGSVLNKAGDLKQARLRTGSSKGVTPLNVHRTDRRQNNGKNNGYMEFTDCIGDVD